MTRDGPKTPIRMAETSVRAHIPIPKGGTLYMCGLPGLLIARDGSSYLDPEHAELTLAYLKSYDVGLIYLFMEDLELPPEARNVLEYLADINDISLRWLPIVDFGIPDEPFVKEWKSQRAFRDEVLQGGKGIAVTCTYGAGRSGMLCAAILAESGVDTKKAVRAVREHYPDAVGNQRQETWVSDGSYLPSL